MDNIAQRLKTYIEAHPFDPGDSDCETVMDQLFQAYQESYVPHTNIKRFWTASNVGRI